MNFTVLFTFTFNEMQKSLVLHITFFSRLCKLTWQTASILNCLNNLDVLFISSVLVPLHIRSLQRPAEEQSKFSEFLHLFNIHLSPSLFFNTYFAINLCFYRFSHCFTICDLNRLWYYRLAHPCQGWRCLWETSEKSQSSSVICVCRDLKGGYRKKKLVTISSV